MLPKSKIGQLDPVFKWKILANTLIDAVVNPPIKSNKHQ